MDKIARKISQDPAQEHLRSSKDEWNKAMKSLISNLIAFKRGINGRGDPSLGIPPSNIKDPMPNEIPNILERISSEYETLASQAYGLIKEQEAYSNNRRKSKETLMPKANDNTDEQLNKVASWWGSRLNTLFQLNDNTKQIRRKILSSLVDIEKYIKKVENSVLDGSPNVIHEVISHYNILMEIYSIRFKELYNYFVADYENNQQKDISEKENDLSIKNEEPISEEIIPEVVNNNSLNENISYNEFRDILNQDISVVNLIMPLLKNNEDKFTLKNFGKTLMRYDIDLSNTDPASEDYQNKLKSLKKVHNDTVNFVKQKTNLRGDTLKEMFQSKTASIQDEDIKKLAASNLSRWFRRKILETSWSSDQVKQIRLDIANTLEGALQKTQILMNKIEKKSITPGSIEVDVDELESHLKNVSSMLFHLGTIHNNLAKLEKAEMHGKKKPLKLTEVLRTDLNKLKQIKND